MDKIPGCDDLPVYGDMGITLGGKPLYFSKDFLIYLPKGVAPEVLSELDEAVAKMQADPQFQEGRHGEPARHFQAQRQRRSYSTSVTRSRKFWPKLRTWRT